MNGVSYEEFKITDRGVALIDKLSVEYDYDGEILIFHQPSGTLLSKEFIENNNRFIKEELSIINNKIDNMNFAIDYKDGSVLAELNDLLELRFNLRIHLHESRQLVNRMY